MNLRKLALGMTPAVLLAITLFPVAGSQPLAAQVASIFSQDLTIQETTTMTGMPMASAKPTTSTKYFSGNAMRTVSSTGEDSIIRFDQKKIFNIDHKQKTYSETTFEQLQEMLDKLGSDPSVDNKQAAEAMKQVFGQTMGQVTVTPKGPGEAIAGYATEKYLVSMPPMEMQIWAAPGLTVPAVYYDTMKLNAKKNPMFDMSKMLDEFKKIKGMTVKTLMSMKMMGMNMETTTIATSIEKGPIPASKFDLPDGYRAVPMKMR